MIEILVLLTMVFFVVMLLHTNQLRLAIIYLAVFSLLSALLYLLCAAPELAIAEGIIGSGIVTLLYLAALKKNRLYTVGVVSIPQRLKLQDHYMYSLEGSNALKDIRDFFVRREVEVQVIFLDIALDQALDNTAYDLILSDDGKQITAYTDDDNYVMLELELMIQMRGFAGSIQFQRSSAEQRGVVAPRLADLSGAGMSRSGADKNESTRMVQSNQQIKEAIE